MIDHDSAANANSDVEAPKTWRDHDDKKTLFVPDRTLVISLAKYDQ